MATEIVALTNIQGFALKTGEDQYGNHWTEFETDYFADQQPGECSICQAEIESGWLCLDGGEEVCHDHISY